MKHALVEQLLADCPFLKDHVDSECLDLPTVIFGRAAGLVIERSLPPEQEDRVFDHFNRLADSSDREALDVLGTGGADKAQIHIMVQRLLAGAKLAGAHAGDALAVAISHAHHLATARRVA